MDGEAYVKLMQDFWERFGKAGKQKSLPWVWQHDNAAVHTCNKAEKALKERAAVVLPWPPTSPDLNPIENLWAYVSRKVYKSQFKSKQELFDAIQREWAAVPSELLASLYDSMPGRLEQVRKACGAPICY